MFSQYRATMWSRSLSHNTVVMQCNWSIHPNRYLCMCICFVCKSVSGRSTLKRKQADILYFVGLKINTQFFFSRVFLISSICLKASFPCFNVEKKFQWEKKRINNIYLFANRCFKARHFIERKLKKEKENTLKRLFTFLGIFIQFWPITKNYDWIWSVTTFFFWISNQAVFFSFLLYEKTFEWIVN